MNDKFKKLENVSSLLNLFPGLIGIIYIFGFVILNSYLSKYGLFTYNLVDKSYISSGVLFLLFTGSIITILVYFVKEPTDNITNSYWEEAKYFLFIITTSISYAFLFIDIDDLPKRFINSFWLILTSIVPLALFFKLTRKLVIVASLLIMLFYYIWAVVHSADARSFLVGFFVFSLLCLILYGHIGDKSFRYVDLVWWLGPLVISAYIFGFYIYGDIKKEFGGGKYSKIQLILNKKTSDEIYRIFKDSSETGLTKSVKLIYENSDYYFISTDSMFFKINKNSFTGYKAYKFK